MSGGSIRGSRSTGPPPLPPPPCGSRPQTVSTELQSVPSGGLLLHSAPPSHGHHTSSTTSKREARSFSSMASEPSIGAGEGQINYNRIKILVLYQNTAIVKEVPTAIACKHTQLDPAEGCAHLPNICSWCSSTHSHSTTAVQNPDFT